MKVLIIVFSPFGSTKKVGDKIQDALIKNNIEAHTIDITGNKKLWLDHDYDGFFKSMQKHDVLIIGGPVYAHLLPDNMIEFIDNLPNPDNDKYPKFVIPFVTYGGISSGIALLDAANHLKNRNRTNIFGMKINAFHSLSRVCDKKLNDNMPSDEIATIIDELTKRLKNFKFEWQADASEYFNYQTNYQKPKKRHFPKIEIDDKKCTLCKNCVTACPVCRIQLKDGQPTFNSSQCIYCGECFFCCKYDAIKWDVSSFKSFLENAAENKNPINESAPYSAIYPLNNN